MFLLSNTNSILKKKHLSRQNHKVKWKKSEITPFLEKSVKHSFRIYFQISSLMSCLKKYEDKETSIKRSAFAHFSDSSQKIKQRSSETMPLWLSMRVCVNVCAWKSAHSQYGNFPNL